MDSPKSNQELLDEINSLKEELKQKDAHLSNLYSELKLDHNLNNDEISRYSRQIFVDLINVKGQEKLKASSILIVGCGGLGCPAAQYLGSIGIGRIGLVDYDEVELNNLHRQVLHLEESVGTPKVDSLAAAIKRQNSNVCIEKHYIQLSSTNCLSTIQKYNIVIDATDNVATRYLLNDACVLAGKPLVSGAAVKTEGQLTVYCYDGGPCYRCLFPQPPPPQLVANCGDVGVLPPVPGVIGVLQALQAIHIILDNKCGILSQRMLLFDGEQTAFRTIKLRTQSDHCSVCGKNPTIKNLIDYEQFCGSPANDKMRGVSLLDKNERATVSDLKHALLDPPTLLIDVRSTTEFEMCRLPGSINIPLKNLESECQLITDLIHNNPKSKVYIICRRGNDSQIAVTQLRKSYPQKMFVDILGGLHAWTKNIDSSFPIY